MTQRVMDVLAENDPDILLCMHQDHGNDEMARRHDTGALEPQAVASMVA